LIGFSVLAHASQGVAKTDRRSQRSNARRQCCRRLLWQQKHFFSLRRTILVFSFNFNNKVIK